MLIDLRKYTDKNKWIIWALRKKIARCLSDKAYLSLRYKAKLGRKIDWKDPKTFNEKLQWLKIHDRKAEYTKMVDKYGVRKYIVDTIGKEYLIPLLGVWNAFEDIDFDKLPNQFVLKCTHDSGGLVICKDKSSFDIVAAKDKINKCLKRNYYYYGREWPYKNVTPRIVCEKFISDTNNTPDDYKVLCFNGKAKLIQFHVDRFENHHTQDFYDENWNKKSISQWVPNSDIIYPKPIEFEKMIQLSNKLAANMYHVRIDWYIVQNRLYFGEITFYDTSGLIPFDKEEDDYLIGSWIELPKEKK